MAPSSQGRWFRGGYWVGMIFLVETAIRVMVQFADQANLIPAAVMLALFALFYVLEPLLSPRMRWPWPLYLVVQTGLVVLLSNLRPFYDATSALFIPLIVQGFPNLPRRTAVWWVAGSIVLLTGTLIFGMAPANGLVLSLLITAVAVFLASYDLIYSRARVSQAQSQALLAELRDAHGRLQEHAAQAQELAGARERIRLARELHDTVSQLVFSIRLTARSAQLLLEREPARVPEQLDHLQAMSGDALSQLRSLITEMRSLPRA